MLLRVSADLQPFTYVIEFQPRYGLLVRQTLVTMPPLIAASM